MNVIPSATSKRLPSRGFSLLELVVVMAIIAIIVGVAAYTVTAPRLEKEMRETHHDIEDLALQARSLSFSYQQPFVIEFTETQARLKPLAVPDESDGSTLSEETTAPSSLTPLGEFEWPRVVNFGDDYEIAIRNWSSADYIKIEDDEVKTWVHQPNSPCEPLAIQLKSHDGRALLSRSFHPLTARGEDDEMTIITN